MKVLMSLGIAITLSLIGGSGEAKAAGCEAIGNVRFICDQLVHRFHETNHLRGIHAVDHGLYPGF